jgi:translation initiation factor 3 subunit B
MYWQNEGTYLLVKVEKRKSKTQTVINFELFRLKEKDVPVDVVETKVNETIGSIAWEPEGDRFVALSNEGQKVFANFYQMLDTSTGSVAGVVEGCKLMKSVERKGVNQIYWSPKGRVCVLAGVRGFQGDIEFWDAEDLIMMGAGEHYMCTDIEWDPSGRFLVSSISFWQTQTDTGYILWSMTGQQLFRENIPQFKQLLWRPRPATLLSKEQQKQIKKNLKEYSREFEEIDAAMSNQASREVIERRVSLFKEWKEYRSRSLKEFNSVAKKRIEIWGGFDPAAVAEDEEADKEELEEMVEDVIDEVEEIVD